MGAGSAMAQWPEFRGPSGQGHAVGKPPTKVDTQAAMWKQAIPGSGWSSPVVHQDTIFLTTAVAQADDSQWLYVMGLDANTGAIQFQTKLFEHAKAKIHSKNSHASPTPLISGGKVFAHFGPHGTAAVDLKGNVLWKNETLDYPPVHGNGGSPILVGDKLIFSADGAREPFIVALSAGDGSVAWKTPRGNDAKKKFSFSTPLAIQDGARTLIVSPGSDRLSALDSETGEEVWFAHYTGYSVIPRPVAGHGMVFVSTSYDRPNVLAVKLGGAGDVTDSHIAWRETKGAPHTPSMVLHGNELYMVSDGGVASCVDAVTGKLHWRERMGGKYSASPVLANDMLYFVSESGDFTVLACGKEYHVLAQSELNERTLASPAVVDDTLIVRTEEHLYRFK